MYGACRYYADVLYISLFAKSCLQSFHPPPSLCGFYRYLRIEFHSYYGSEYYCPVSLVRVYGLTHLEEWKWELWEAESRAKMEASLKDTQIHSATESVDSSPSIDQTSASVYTSDEFSSKEEPTHFISVLSTNGTENELPSSVAGITGESSHSTNTYLSPQLVITRPPGYEVFPSSSLPISASVSVTPSPLVSMSNHSIESSLLPPHNGTSLSLLPFVSPTTTRPSSSIFVTASPLSTVHSSLPMAISGGESIYRMIMNRLTSIEKNHTLYEQYMAQQQNIVRETLKRMGEDIGRLEGLVCLNVSSYVPELMSLP